MVVINTQGQHLGKTKIMGNGVGIEPLEGISYFARSKVSMTDFEPWKVFTYNWMGHNSVVLEIFMHLVVFSHPRWQLLLGTTVVTSFIQAAAISDLQSALRKNFSKNFDKSIYECHANDSWGQRNMGQNSASFIRPIM